MSSLRMRVEQLSPQPHTLPSIYKVPRQLCDVNNKAYEPEMVAIGPYHHGKDKFKITEELKLRYFKSLLECKPETPVEHYVSAMEGIAGSARDCYAEPSVILDSSHQFIDMLVLDGCFIIKIIRDGSLYERTFPAKSSNRTLQRDLILLENQIPLFVLFKLFDLIEGPEQHSLLRERVLKFWDDFFPGGAYRATKMKSLEEVKHILDLVYSNWCPPSLADKHHKKCERWSCCPCPETFIPRAIPTASKLRDGNVKFRFKEYHSNTIFFNVDFNKCGRFVMPTLVVDDNTESLLRNLIAYEQLLPKGEPTYITDYATLLESLIDTSKDVQILSGEKIIENFMGSDKAVVEFVNRLTETVLTYDDNFLYKDIFHKINVYHQKRWNKAVAVFRRDYFGSPWAYIAFFGSLLLLLLTVAQTFFSALEVFGKPAHG